MMVDLSFLILSAVPWWKQKVDFGDMGQPKPWKTCWMCPVSDLFSCARVYAHAILVFLVC